MPTSPAMRILSSMKPSKSFLALLCALAGVGSQQPLRPASPSAPDFEKQEQEYFETCDYNGNGWISMAEARQALALDQNAFRVYDADKDGRITRVEFGSRYRALIARHGSFKPPVGRTTETFVPLRNAEQLRNAYDRNGDLGIDEKELEKLLGDYDREELPIAIVLEKLDRDETTRIDGDELELLARLLSLTHSTLEVAPASNARSIEELFGGLQERATAFQSAPQPPAIRGPVRSEARRVGEECRSRWSPCH